MLILCFKWFCDRLGFYDLYWLHERPNTGLAGRVLIYFDVNVVKLFVKVFAARIVLQLF